MFKGEHYVGEVVGKHEDGWLYRVRSLHSEYELEGWVRGSKRDAVVAMRNQVRHLDKNYGGRKTWRGAKMA